MITKGQFEKLIGEKLFEKDGKLIYDGDFDLYNCYHITDLPDNLKVLGFLYLSNSSITKLPKSLEVRDELIITETNIEELPEDTKFGSLYACNMYKPFSFPKVVTVSVDLWCENTTIKRMPKELYVNGSCSFSESKFNKLPNIMEVENTLHLKYCNKKEIAKRLVVGCELDLQYVNLKDYSNLHKICTRFIVDGRKYDKIKKNLPKHWEKSFWGGVCVTFLPNYKGSYLFENENGRYIKVDDIFGKIVEQEDNVFHIRLGRNEKITYLVTDGKCHWSYGNTLEEAKDDLINKVNKMYDGFIII